MKRLHRYTKDGKRSTFTALALAMVMLVVLPGTLRAFKVGKLSFYITNDFLYQYNKLAGEEDYNQFYESFTLFANYDKWSVGMTLRGNNFLKQSPNITLDKMETDLYRKYVQYNSKHLQVTVGDFYAMLGRGMVLSVLKNDDILQERTILGGNIRYNKGRLELRALGGEIRDETTDQEWFVAGGEATVEYTKNHRIGAHFSYINDISSWMELGKRFTTSVSVTGSKLMKYFSYYAEAAFLDYMEENQYQENGYGLYSNITYNRGHITTFLEFKRYRDFNNRMNNPPMADRVDEISSANDTTGARLYFQYAFFEPDITLFFNVARYKEYEHTGNHIYGGFSIEDYKDRLNLSLSYGVRDIRYPIKRWDGHMVYQFTDLFSGEITIKDRRYTDKNFIFKESDHTFQLSYSPYISVFAMHQYSHNKIIGLNHFFSGGIKVFLRGGTTIELSGGTIRGGQICSGGQCFVAPPFKGVKCAVLHTFK